MNCHQIVSVLYSYMDSEMEPGMRIEIEQHFIECRPCVARVEFEKYLVIHVKRCCQNESVPPNLQSRILQILEDE